MQKFSSVMDQLVCWHINSLIVKQLLLRGWVSHQVAAAAGDWQVAVTFMW